MTTLQGKSILVTGGGSPAIPLKLASPSLHVRMVEVKMRKAVFLREAVRTLGLREAEVETARFEELLPRAELHEALDLPGVSTVAEFRAAFDAWAGAHWPGYAPGLLKASAIATESTLLRADSPLPADGRLALLPPVIVAWLLLRMSGLPLTEVQAAATRPGYADYITTTSAFVPWPPKPALWRRWPPT